MSGETQDCPDTREGEPCRPPHQTPALDNSEWMEGVMDEYLQNLEQD